LSVFLSQVSSPFGWTRGFIADALGQASGIALEASRMHARFPGDDDNALHGTLDARWALSGVRAFDQPPLEATCDAVLDDLPVMREIRHCPHDEKLTNFTGM